MYYRKFPQKLSNFFKKEPSDSGGGYISCDCESVCRNRNCLCYTASKFCTNSCSCYLCMNKPQRQNLRRINEFPAYNRGRWGGVCQSDSGSGVIDEEKEEDEEEEDTYWEDWCRETEKYSHRKTVGNKEVPCLKTKQRETSPQESVGETPLRSRTKNYKSERKEESPISKRKENKSKSKSRTSDKKKKKE